MHRKTVVVVFFLLGLQFSLAQQSYSLSYVLDYLTNKYTVTFSYNASVINTYSNIVFPRFKQKNLKSVIKDLASKTGLIFEQIDLNNYLVIQPENNNQNYRLICGKILDELQNPLSSIPVVLENQITKTNAAGFFYLERSNSEAMVVVKCLGYQTVFLPVGQLEGEGCKTVILVPKIEKLEEVVIENYLTKGLSKKENGSIAVHIEKTGILPGVIEPDALQSLQFIPGLQSPDETATGLHIRGSTPDQNLVLFDGVKMYQNAHFFGLLSAFNPYLIDNIKLFRSATKAKYGGHAGGVISISLKDKMPNKISTGVGATLTHVNLDVKIPVLNKKLALFAGARRGITDFLNSITFQNYSEVAFQNTNIINSVNASANSRISTPNFLYQDYQAKLVYKPNSVLQIDLGFLNNSNSLSFSGLNPFFDSEINDNLEVNNNTGYAKFLVENDFYGAHALQFSTTSFSKKFIGLQNVDFSVQQPTLLEITFDKENEVNETTLQYRGTKNINSDNSIQFGYQRNWSQVAYTADSFGLDLRTFQELFRGNEISQAFYLDYVLKAEKTHFNLGLRRQYFNRLHNVFWEPRAFINYNLFSKFWLKASYELKHQSISQVTDLRNDGLGSLFNRLWVVSTEQSIPIVRNNQFGFGFDFQSNGWTLDVEFYDKKVDGIGILLNDNIFQPRNVSGIDRVQGVDLLLKKKWKYYGSWLSYSYSQSEYQFQEINSNRPFRGSFDIPHSLIWTHALNWKDFSFSLGYRFRNGIPYTPKRLDLNNPQSNFLIFQEFNSRRLPNYHRLDFTLGYDFLLQKQKNIKAKFGFTLQNITNTKNILSRDFRVEERFDSSGNPQLNTAVLTQIDRISLGFTPNLLFRILL